MSDELAVTDFRQLDRLDEEQILAELQGVVLDQYVYSFKSGGRQVTGLSWAGVKAVAARMGSVQVDLLQLTSGEGGWTCVVKATAPDGSSRIGAAEQPYEMDTRKGPQPDPFALPKCVSKAQRNAIRALLPESLIAEVVKMRQAQRQPARKPTNGKAKTPGPAKWAHNADTVARMMTEAEKIGLSQSDVLLALLVEDVRDFAGTKAEAWGMIESYAARQPQPATSESVEGPQPTQQVVTDDIVVNPIPTLLSTVNERLAELGIDEWYNAPAHMANALRKVTGDTWPHTPPGAGGWPRETFDRLLDVLVDYKVVKEEANA